MQLTSSSLNYTIPYTPYPKSYVPCTAQNLIFAILLVSRHIGGTLPKSLCLTRTFCEIGTALDRVGQPTLGAFIAKSVQSGQVTSASSLVELLASTFPTFDDRSTCGGAEVCTRGRSRSIVLKFKCSASVIMAIERLTLAMQVTLASSCVR